MQEKCKFKCKFGYGLCLLKIQQMTLPPCHVCLKFSKIQARQIRSPLTSHLDGLQPWCSSCPSSLAAVSDAMRWHPPGGWAWVPFSACLSTPFTPTRSRLTSCPSRSATVARNTTGWVTCNSRHLFLTVLRAGVSKMKALGPLVSDERSRCHEGPSSCQKGKGCRLWTHVKAPNPPVKTPPSCPDHLPKPPLPTSNPLSLRIQHTDFRGQ